MAESIDKKRARNARWRAKNRIQTRERQRLWRLENKDRIKNSALKSGYGITLEDYNNLLQIQGGVCAVCLRGPGQRALHVDHDHTTGKVRGLLCSRCNVTLGMMDEKVEILMNLVEYLRLHE